jgi:NADPH:quinone reductase-like Zn-dependent oxidoreductase
MKALRFEKFGGLDVLVVAELPRPVPQAGEVLVAIRAASINPSDVKNVAGKMEGTTLPRTPGRDFAGFVAEGPPGLRGLEVYGAGGDIGFTRDGSHAEYIVVPEDGVARKPANLSFEEAAAVGVNFVTAWAGLNDAVHLGPGETVFVTGAAGGVGTSVVQLARWMGATSIGVDVVKQTFLPDHLRADFNMTTSEDVLAGVQRATGGRGADVVYDTVGAPLFETNLAVLAPGGRYVLISSAGERRVSFDLLDFYHKRLVLAGVDSRVLDTRACARTLDRLRAGFETSRLRPPRIAQRFAIEDAKRAYEAASGAAGGKIVLTASAY